MTRPARRSPWTPALDARLRHLWRIEGVPAAEIARRLGVTHDAVLHRAGVLDLCRHPAKSGPGWTDNLRIPRIVWWERDFAFWTVKQASEVA